MSIAVHPVAQLAVSEQPAAARSRKPPPNRVLIAKADLSATPEPR